jgi:hypothetical protein
MNNFVGGDFEYEQSVELLGRAGIYLGASAFSAGVRIARKIA